MKNNFLAEKIIAALHGKNGVNCRLNGSTIQMGENKKLLYIDDLSIPIDQLGSNLTAHELLELENLPAWDGNNSYLILVTCVRNVRSAINRFRFKPDEDSHIPVNYQMAEVAMCNCNKCGSDREAAMKS